MKVLRGRVVRGRRLGRRLGFPTANLKVAAAASLRGVWRVRVRGTTLGERLAVCNVGSRPTLGGRSGLVVEVHIPGFAGDLYGRTLSVAFLSRIRRERRFPNLAALKARIRRDVAALTRGAGGARMSP